METNAFFNYLENYIYLHLMESICFYFMLKQTHFPSRDFIQQEVLNSRKTGSHTEKQVWTCLVKKQGLPRGNDSSIYYRFQGHESSRMISYDSRMIFSTN